MARKPNTLAPMDFGKGSSQMIPKGIYCELTIGSEGPYGMVISVRLRVRDGKKTVPNPH
jgi:hypothetical protein